RVPWPFKLRRRRLARAEDKLLNAASPSIIVVGSRDVSCRVTDFVDGLPHGDADARLPEHIDVVWTVADYRDLISRDLEDSRESHNDGALVNSKGGDIEKPGLRFRGRDFAAQIGQDLLLGLGDELGFPDYREFVCFASEPVGISVELGAEPRCVLFSIDKGV